MVLGVSCGGVMDFVVLLFVNVLFGNVVDVVVVEICLFFFWVKFCVDIDFVVIGVDCIVWLDSSVILFWWGCLV